MCTKNQISIYASALNRLSVSNPSTKGILTLLIILDRRNEHWYLLKLKILFVATCNYACRNWDNFSYVFGDSTTLVEMITTFLLLFSDGLFKVFYLHFKRHLATYISCHIVYLVQVGTRRYKNIFPKWWYPCIYIMWILTIAQGNIMYKIREPSSICSRPLYIVTDINFACG